MATTKYYAVRRGRETGIFHSWDECKAKVSGFSGAEYKSFPTELQALEYLGIVRETSEEAFSPEDTTMAKAYVDGSYQAVTGEFSYGMVILRGGEEFSFNKKYDNPELAAMRNVAGEIKGAEAAMRYAEAEGIKTLWIYHDYEGIAKWCQGDWKANKEGTKAYKAYYDSIKDRISIRFVKVAAHTGDTYNEMADRLAKQALL